MNNKLDLKDLIENIYQQLLSQVKIESINPHDPVQVNYFPQPWRLLGTGNYAAVFCHPDYPDQVVKIYAPGRPGYEEEVEVYSRIGEHPAFSKCYYAEPNFLVLKRLYGNNLYDCIQRGMRIPEQVIHDVDNALEYARQRGLYPHDIHARNVMMYEGRGFVVDISDFLHQESCSKWNNFKRAYYWLYRPILCPLGLRVPYFILDIIRKVYRTFSSLRAAFFRQLRIFISYKPLKR
ncbi:MAG: serine/threonine protein kinase [Calothrix sp. C42_A2020_038]|nr:serine/threonine protein kinase [Calothrix sp. C42_A2020_038]